MGNIQLYKYIQTNEKELSMNISRQKHDLEHFLNYSTYLRQASKRKLAR